MLALVARVEAGATPAGQGALTAPAGATPATGSRD